MTDATANQKILAALNEAAARLEASEREKREPIAIVGIGCRFPGGANDPESFWRLLHEGHDAIVPTPPDRWNLDTLFDEDPDAPGKLYIREAGFIDGVDRFDPTVFGISPREASAMDPQQRLLLETAWHALEDAAPDWDALRRGAVGVFIGATNVDYARLLTPEGDVSGVETYYLTGTTLNSIAGRLAFVLGLQGPCMAIDTACSSSLTAIHLACQSLRLRECESALAGGVNLLLSPETTIGACKAGMLAKDGRCKTFDAAADGFGRGEGCGVIVLKRLSDACNDRDRVYAVIAGSAVNQDGASGGFTVPNGPAQRSLIQTALAKARLKPHEIDYVEAHGTGTSLGDPIEVSALGEVFSENRSSENPLRIGSVKTNIGHLESAAGIASIIKMALSFSHEEIPATIHFNQPNPHIAWDRWPVQVASSPTSWKPSEKRRAAGVSAFGASGSNAHVILSDPPQSEPEKSESKSPQTSLLTLSAKSPEALRELADRYASFLKSASPLYLHAICQTANRGRARFSHRLALTASDSEKAAAALRDFAQRGEAAHHQVLDSSRSPKIAFLFTGQGAQYSGMGEELYRAAPAFREALDQCADYFRAEGGGELTPLLFDVSFADRLNRTDSTQPALFALEYALASMWREWGIVPSAAAGHSIGEYAAACVTGVMRPDEAMRLAVRRGRLMNGAPSGGVMAAVFADENRVLTALKPYESRASLAAVNGPGQCVVSGEADSIESILASMPDVKHQKLNVSQAFHSPMMDSILPEFRYALESAALSAPRIDFVSTLSGELADERIQSPAYWADQIRNPVRFYPALRELYARGFRVFVEIGPRPVLSSLGMQAGLEGALFLPSIQPGQSEWKRVMETLAELFVHGAAPDWKSVYRSYPARKAALPGYPFQRRRFWVDSSVRSRPGVEPGGRRAGEHPLLGRHLASPLPHRIHESIWSGDQTPFLNDHRVFGRPIAPASALIEMALSATASENGSGSIELRDVRYLRPLIVEEAPRRVQCVLEPAGDASRFTFRIFSAPASEERAEWTLHCEGKVVLCDTEPMPLMDVKEIQNRCIRRLDLTRFYKDFQNRGVEYGEPFRCLRELTCNENEALGHVSLPSGAEACYSIHPALLDGCTQTMGVWLSDPETVYLQSGFDRLVWRRASEPAGSVCLSHAHRRIADPKRIEVDVHIASASGEPIMAIEGLRVEPISRQSVQRENVAIEARLYCIEWEEIGALPDIVKNADLDLTTIESDFTSFIANESPEAGDYRALLHEMESLSAAYAAEALQKLLDTAWASGRIIDLEAWAEKQSAPAHVRLLIRRMVSMLTEDGVLRADDDEIRIAEPPRNRDLRMWVESLLEAYPFASSELTMLQRCGERLASVLGGVCDPLTLLFPPDENSVSVETLYRDTPGGSLMNRLTAFALERAAKGSSSRPVRILEIGGGTGCVTSEVLPRLRMREVEYVFTDVSSWFTERARERFAAYPFVEYRLFNIDHAPEEQGFSEDRFDFILAANVLHVAADVNRTMQNLRRLLKPHGALVMMEAARPLRWVDLIFGLTEGWWRFAEGGAAREHPLLNHDAWREALNAAGFESALCFSPGRGDVDLLSQQSVIVSLSGASSGAIKTESLWIVFEDRRGLSRRFADDAALRGERCVFVKTGDEYISGDDGVICINPAVQEHFTRLLDLLVVRNDERFGILYGWGLDARVDESDEAVDLRDAIQQSAGGALHLIQALIEKAPHPHMMLVPADICEPAQAPLWGVVKTTMLEHPELNPRWVSLDGISDEDLGARRLIAEAREYVRHDEREVTWRNERRLGRRIARYEAENAVEVNHIRSDAAYLITGGLGDIGLLTARWLIDRGAGYIALCGRSEPTGERLHALERLLKNARVEFIQTDVTDAESVSRMLKRLHTEAPPLRGVIHAAGVFDDRLLADHEWRLFEDVLAPKTMGAWNLHRLTQEQGESLDFFILFSSVSSMLGSAGMANYVAANAFLDELARYRHRLGMPALSVNWGLWHGTGMAVAVGERRDRQYKTSGLIPMPPEECLKRLDQCLFSPLPQLAVAAIDWKAALASYPPGRVPSFYRRVEPQTVATPIPAKDGILDRLASAHAADARQLMLDHVRGHVASVLGMESLEMVGLEQGFMDMGMDSLTSLELRNRLQSSLRRSLSSTIAFKFPSVTALTDYLVRDDTSFESPDSPQVEAMNKDQEETEKLAEVSEDDMQILLQKKLESLE
ncbi:MAG: SDR family NAD(P)-dependent oxidoreductase [bacterium]|nr:SDR family NAD(P)-dependent oxidoreductase [bacterium]